MFLQVSVCPQGAPGPGGVHGPGGLHGPGGHLVLGGCLVPGVGVDIPACTEADPPGRDGYCCGRYASYIDKKSVSHPFSSSNKCIYAGMELVSVNRP